MKHNRILTKAFITTGTDKREKLHNESSIMTVIAFQGDIRWKQLGFII
ncbi:hypothetical protein NST21_24265 [Peribacillus sp. FSL K6-1552]